MEKALLVAAGGAAGSLARWLLAERLNSGTGFPRGTFAVNVLGSFLIGAVLHAVSDGRPSSERLSENLRLLLAVGVLGGFTTYSAFAHETWRLAGAGQWGLAAGYAALTTFLCLAAVALGAKCAAVV